MPLLNHMIKKMIKRDKTAIVGKPNVGKSSILNSVLKEKSNSNSCSWNWVRDVIEEVVNLKEYLLYWLIQLAV